MDLKEKYKHCFKRFGATFKNIDEFENELVEKMILEYYTSLDISVDFINELKFVIENVENMSVRNRILCREFIDKHGYTDINQESIDEDRIIYLS